MRLAPAALEDWMRGHYFSTVFDLGSSGVPCWTLGELRRQLGLGDALDTIALDDSPTLGDGELRQAIADRYGDGDPERVMVTHGSSEAIFLVVNALLSDGGEVVVTQPGYHSLRSVAEALGCVIRLWPLISGRDMGADLTALEAIAGPRTAAIIVNFPHNPTGISLTSGEQGQLIEIASGCGAWLVWDNAFAELTYEAPALPDPSGMYDRCLATGTMSKAYGLPGLRIGWVMAPPDLLNRLIPLRDALAICVSPLVQRLATGALRAADRLVTTRLATACRNRELLSAWAGAWPELVDYRAPDGGVTAFPRLCPLASTDQFCQELHETSGVLLIPGSCFGHPDRVRLGFAAPTGAFQQGLELLTRHLSATARERRSS
jgi:capreomycidine synthase